MAETGRVADAPPELPPLARRPVFAAMAAVAVVLTMASGRYGYHRDELYFRLLDPAWGYRDQPPLTPMLARAFSALADEAWALRIPATLATVASVYVAVLVTRELGGGRTAQTLCAWGYGFASMPLITGHALLTSTVDLPVWPLLLLFVVRAELRRQPAWWLAAGLVAGLSTYNKLLVAILLVAVAAGLAVVGPRRLLWSRWVLGGVAVAVLVSAPNLVYQATHDWPQLSMGAALAEENAGEVRVVMWPFLALILGPPLVPIWVAGLVALIRRPAWRPVRFLAVSFPVLLLLVFLMGAQFYYPLGVVAVLFAAGCVPAAEWMVGWRRAVAVAAVALNAAVSLVLGLPVVPVGSLGGTPIPGINQIARDTVGWPAYVRQIAAVHATVPVTEGQTTVIVTSNYGEAGAVDRYGGPYDLPRVYSGHNQLFYAGGPPVSATTVVFVGGQLERARGYFGYCEERARLDNGVDVDNEEQGQPVAVCTEPIGGWATVWAALRHES